MDLDRCLSTAPFGGRFPLGPGSSYPRLPGLCQARGVTGWGGVGGFGYPSCLLNPALTGHSLSLQVALIFVSCFIFSSIRIVFLVDCFFFSPPPGRKKKEKKKKEKAALPASCFSSFSFFFFRQEEKKRNQNLLSPCSDSLPQSFLWFCLYPLHYLRRPPSLSLSRPASRALHPLFWHRAPFLSSGLGAFPRCLSQVKKGF